MLPKRIEELEGYIERAQGELADPDLFVRDNARFTKLTDAIGQWEAEKESAEERWLELAEMIEQLES